MELRLEATSVALHGKAIIDEVSATIPQQGLTCLLGANGAGKTTLLRILSGELRATSGKYFIGDKDTSSLNRQELARFFAIIPQNAPAPPYLTVSELIAMGLFCPGKSLSWKLSESDTKIVDKCLARCHLEELQKRRLEELSGGERQRAWLAFGLAPAKDFLMLDETLDGMDFFIKRSFIHLLKEITRDGKSILLTTHDLSLVTEFADKIIVLVNGRITYQGTPPSDFQQLIKVLGQPPD